MKRLNIEDFIKKAIEIHGNKYDYSLVEYTGALNKVKIICPKHGIFEQTPNQHINCNKGCPKCSNKIPTIKDLIINFNIVHKNKYDYSLVEYKNSRTKIKIICPIHGIFEQTPTLHKRGHGCNNCKSLEQESFIEQSNLVHNFKYDYSLVNYVNWKTKIKIICPIHGIFEQRPNNHKDLKQGCPYCNESHGEQEILKYLNEKNIDYIRQYKYKNCKNILSLPFDFYLPEYNICIEFDGEQHFREHKIWGNDKLIKTKINDKIKNEYCLNNNIRLIRIKFDENINEKLNLIK